MVEAATQKRGESGKKYTSPLRRGKTSRRRSNDSSRRLYTFRPLHKQRGCHIQAAPPLHWTSEDRMSQ